MTSDRPYRKVLPMPVVIDELNKFSGRQFDPKVVDAFMRLLEQHGDDFISKDEKFDIDAFIDT
jgi:HD-GYP domain-containing protein (c-di-GMP phosphodiesterase class II)